MTQDKKDPGLDHCWVHRHGRGDQEWRTIVAYSVRDGVWYVYTAYRNGDGWTTPTLTGGAGFKDPEPTKRLVMKMQLGLPRGEWVKEPGHCGLPEER